MTTAKGQPHVPTSTKYGTYQNFVGIDRSLEREMMESKNETPLWECWNAICDWRGSIVREPPFYHLEATGGGSLVKSLKFFNTQHFCWAEEWGDGVYLKSSMGHALNEAYTIGATVSMAVFRGDILAFSPNQPPYSYNGSSWQYLPISKKPGFGVAIQNRLAIGGMPGTPTEVLFSRVNDATVFPDEEAIDNTAVTKASFIDIRNLIGTADIITGLGSFEVNRLAIFTRDQCLIYVIDPDYTLWELDQRANLRIGCISHGTIVNAESDLFFCSRHGVHSIARSDANGVTVSTVAMSRRIEEYYKHLVRETEDLSSVSAMYDQDDGLYHIFFPRPYGCIRLTMDIRNGYDGAHWTQGDFLNARCGDALGGRVLMGTPGGVYELGGRRPAYMEPTQSFRRGKVRVSTGILWHGDMDNEKIAKILKLRATGSATIVVRAYDEEGLEITAQEVTVEAPSGITETFPDVPLSRLYELPFHTKYKGVQFTIETADDDVGDLRIMGFAVDIAAPK